MVSTWDLGTTKKAINNHSVTKCKELKEAIHWHIAGRPLPNIDSQESFLGLQVTSWSMARRGLTGDSLWTHNCWVWLPTSYFLAMGTKSKLFSFLCLSFPVQTKQMVSVLVLEWRKQSDQQYGWQGLRSASCNDAVVSRIGIKVFFELWGHSCKPQRPFLGYCTVQQWLLAGPKLEPPGKRDWLLIVSIRLASFLYC